MAAQIIKSEGKYDGIRRTAQEAFAKAGPKAEQLQKQVNEQLEKQNSDIRVRRTPDGRVTLVQQIR